ncbi:MAG: DUF4166 domain-containing protein [Blastocatellales bacterium]
MSSRLYPKLLGASWCDLDVAVRRLHGSGRMVRAVGVFQVRHGSNSLARALARLARLPAAGEAVDVRLQVTAREEGEKWQRAFAGHPLVSMQSNLSGRLLVERIGVMELRFRLEVAGGALGYQTVSAALRLGSLRVPLPHLLSPCVTAWEKASDNMDQIHVSVDVTFPLIGRLIAYDGVMTQVEAQR